MSSKLLLQCDRNVDKASVAMTCRFSGLQCFFSGGFGSSPDLVIEKQEMFRFLLIMIFHRWAMAS